MCVLPSCTWLLRRQVNGTAMPSNTGAELTISSHINDIKARNELIVIGFELPSGEHKVLTFESYVTRADLKAALRQILLNSTTTLRPLNSTTT